MMSLVHRPANTLPSAGYRQSDSCGFAPAIERTWGLTSPETAKRGIQPGSRSRGRLSRA